MMVEILKLTSKVVAVVLVKTSLRITLAAKSSAIEHGGDGCDGGLAEAILHRVRDVKAVLATLLLVSVKLVHRVIRVQEAVHIFTEVCSRYSVDILNPGALRVVIDEGNVKLLHDGDLGRPVVLHDGGPAADVGGAGGQGEDGLVHIRHEGPGCSGLVTSGPVSEGAIGDIDTDSDLRPRRIIRREKLVLG